MLLSVVQFSFSRFFFVVVFVKGQSIFSYYANELFKCSAEMGGLLQWWRYWEELEKMAAALLQRDNDLVNEEKENQSSSNNNKKPNLESSNRLPSFPCRPGYCTQSSVLTCWL